MLRGPLSVYGRAPDTLPNDCAGREVAGLQGQVLKGQMVSTCSLGPSLLELWVAYKKREFPEVLCCEDARPHGEMTWTCSDQWAHFSSALSHPAQAPSCGLSESSHWPFTSSQRRPRQERWKTGLCTFPNHKIPKDNTTGYGCRPQSWGHFVTQDGEQALWSSPPMEHYSEVLPAAGLC